MPHKYAVSVLETNRAHHVNEITRMESTLNYHMVNAGNPKITASLTSTIQDHRTKLQSIDAMLACVPPKV